MKKALLVTRVSGFIPQFEMNNVKILQEMGYEVHYASNFRTIVYGKDNTRLEKTGIICHQVDFTRSPVSINVGKSYRQLRKLIKEGAYDLIHCHMPMSGVLARMAAESVRKETGRKVPVIYTAHGLHFYTGAPFKNWIYYPVERHLAKYTDCMILINKEDYKRASKFPIRGNVEYTRGIGMSLEKFVKYDFVTIETDDVQKKKRTECRESLRKRFDIPKDRTVLVSVGELTGRKNHIIMILAMQELRDLNVHYLICGVGPKELELRKEVEELGLEDRVTFAGYVTDVPDVLAGADCFVFPSLQEGLPVAVMEAMAVGLPIIASRIRGITDLIAHTKGGYLVDGFAPDDYATAIRRMFTENKKKSPAKRTTRRIEMGCYNRNRIVDFSLPVVEKKMRKIYKKMDELAVKNLSK